MENEVEETEESYSSGFAIFMFTVLLIAIPYFGWQFFIRPFIH